MLLALLLAAAAATPQQTADLKFLQDLTQTRSYRLGRPVQVRVTPDGSRVLFLRSEARNPVQRLFSFDLQTGKERELVSPEQITKGAAEQLSPEEKARRERMRISASGFTSYSLSEDGSEVLVTSSGRAYVVPVEGGAAREVAGPDEKGAPIFDPRLSPDGQQVSFVRGGELWVAPVAGGAARQLTQGASPTLIHAQAEFVAQEELDRYTGYWWSPDSRQLVYEEFDASHVERLDITDPAHPERAQPAAYYPRPGKPNVTWRFGIVPAAGGATRWLDLGKWEYVANVEWQKNAPLTFHVFSRDQKDAALLAVEDGAGRELIREHDDAWINAPHAYQWLPDGSGFLWGSESRGNWQLELHAAGGALQKVLTPNEPGFKALVHLEGRKAFFLAGADPMDSQLFSVSLDGGTPTRLTQGPDEHGAVYARETAAHVLVTNGTRYQVVRADQTVAGELASVNEKAPFDIRLSVQQAAGFWTAIVRPHNFDRTKKYPVLLEVYGGPHSRTVHRRPEAYFSSQWIADHGFIVVHADNRGTPDRGRAWERAIYRSFAEVPLTDQVAALQALARLEPAIDLSRVGVMGHSFGGFMAALCVERRPDVFRAAVSGAPVVDWLDYDTAYTERYLGVPPPAGQSDAYPRNGLVPYAGNLSRPILLLHGTADDNVHFAESLTLLDAVFRAGHSDLVDFLPQVGQTHMFREPEMMVRYWQRVFEFLDNNVARNAAKR